MSDRFPTLAEAINAAVESAQRQLLVWLPAKVVKYDSSTQKANCQILIKQVTESEEGERESASWPVIPGVPVEFPGANGYRLAFAVTNGDIGTLFFSGRSIDKWLTGSGGEVDPEFDHSHALADAKFVPGLRPFGSAWQDVPSSGLSIGKDSGRQITITDSLITLASPAGNPQFVALANLVAAELGEISTAIAGVGGAYTPGPVAASNTKAE